MRRKETLRKQLTGEEAANGAGWKRGDKKTENRAQAEAKKELKGKKQEAQKEGGI